MSAVDESVTATPRPVQDTDADLGFGSVVVRESRRRLLNRDGTFNVRRDGLRFWESLSAYHYFVTISWSKFIAWVVVYYLSANALFAGAYVACGAHALTAFRDEPLPLRFMEAFFFSVHTLATIGYGSVAPANTAANVVVTIESLVGILAFALIAGIAFSRFSRPVPRIVFSRKAVIAPYRGIRAFMFRIINQRSNQLVDVETKVLLSRRKREGSIDREFISLELERNRVVFFPLAWTIVHPIDEKSPLWDWDAEDLRECDIEFLILLNGFDETFSQTVHTRSSYKASEVEWGARFTNMFNPPGEDGIISVDIRKLHDTEPAQV